MQCLAFMRRSRLALQDFAARWKHPVAEKIMQSQKDKASLTRQTAHTSAHHAFGLALAAFLGLAMGAFAPALAEEDDARKILKAMSDYLADQNTISGTFDSGIEVITSDLQKIEFTSSGEFLLARPDKIRVTRTGGYADVEMIFDGKTATIYGKNLNAYAKLDVPGTVDQLIDRLRADYVDMPGGDLLMSNVYEALMEDVVEAKHIGRGVINGVECEHLAFRNPDVDWQIWVETGEKPIPRKYVITSKAVTGAPEYVLTIREWKTGVPVKSDAFAFKKPSGAKVVDVKALGKIDEVPPGVAIGESK
jgi:hypothetical protein